MLKNNGALPMISGASVVPVGVGSFDTLKCGGGSSRVFSEYSISIAEGLTEKAAEGKINLPHELFIPQDNSAYTSQIISDLTKNYRTVVLTISRFATETADLLPQKGNFYLDDSETALLSLLEQCPNVKDIIVILNIPSVIDLASLEQYGKVNAVLVMWYAGMEGGRGIADILVGDSYPCGKLVDTFADINDYPSTATFFHSDTYQKYEDDIYVGYRYFETFAPHKVLYHFGFGLSYTDFAIDTLAFSQADGEISVTVKVTNIGNFKGKEVVQCYVKPPRGKLDKPYLELKDFKKTAELAPAESCELTLRIDKNDLASFDDTNASGNLGSYILEAGEYKFFVGNSIRSISHCGSINIEKTAVILHTGMKLTAPIDRKTNGINTYTNHCIDASYDVPTAIGYTPTDKIITLVDVSEGLATMKEFISQLTDSELVELCHAQPPSIVRSTAGVGNNSKYMIPMHRLQTVPTVSEGPPPPPASPAAQ